MGEFLIVTYCGWGVQSDGDDAAFQGRSAEAGHRGAAAGGNGGDGEVDYGASGIGDIQECQQPFARVEPIPRSGGEATEIRPTRNEGRY